METAIQTGAKVMLFFNCHHDEKNTIASEVKSDETFKKDIANKCTCCEFNGKVDFEESVKEYLQKF